MTDLARRWFGELRRDPSESGAGQAVVLMNFTAPPEQQWQFILAAVSIAKSDDDLAHLAAGPIEHLLSRHGVAYIGFVRKEAARNRNFARALTGVWQHEMAPEIWAQLQTIEAQVLDPIRPSKGGA